MVPFDASLCRSRGLSIEMEADDPDANLYAQALATHPVKIGAFDRFWVPPAGEATRASCAAASARASGFGKGDFGPEQASALVRQAREAFALAARGGKIGIRCEGEPYYAGGDKPADAAWGPAHVRFTFPYAAGGATWLITVDRSPAITAVHMTVEYITCE